MSAVMPSEDQRPTDEQIRIVEFRFQYAYQGFGIYFNYLSDIAKKMGLQEKDFHSSTYCTLQRLVDKDNRYLFTRVPVNGVPRGAVTAPEDEVRTTEIPGTDIIKLAIEIQSLNAEKYQLNELFRKLFPDLYNPIMSYHGYFTIDEDGRNWILNMSQPAGRIKEKFKNAGIFSDESMQMQEKELCINREAVRNLLKPQESISSAAGDAKGISEASALSDVSGFSKGDSKSSADSAQLLPAVSGESKSEAERQRTLLLGLYAEAELALAKPSVVAPPGGPVVDCDSAASLGIHSLK